MTKSGFLPLTETDKQIKEKNCEGRTVRTSVLAEV